jgi:tryptophan synthase alpha chain
VRITLAGLRTAADAAAIGAHADGIVVGSALVSVLAGATGPDDAAARARAFLAPLRAALDGA